MQQIIEFLIIETELNETTIAIFFFYSHTRHNNNTNNKITPQCYLMTYC